MEAPNGETKVSRCYRHSLDESVGTCRSCSRPACERCLVLVRRHSLCIACAIVRSGVRTRAQVPA
jgi:hypothetical protein